MSEVLPSRYDYLKLTIWVCNGKKPTEEALDWTPQQEVIKKTPVGKGTKDPVGYVQNYIRRLIETGDVKSKKEKLTSEERWGEEHEIFGNRPLEVKLIKLRQSTIDYIKKVEEKNEMYPFGVGDTYRKHMEKRKKLKGYTGELELKLKRMESVSSATQRS
ncbi:hypothetical protein AKJ58_01640 [candidate division MSBL1 archaeon SCGC-AAA385D11]|uniref:Uncharacterized protein n=1 Tax=candidate division MSBL1 archaeon SCGC-AAA385D11 TaxID=1698286 RepID=A0A133VN38_9EURY|nr:hypothetical protein AKJ58_01640 [candidate division MSBL1 archaeon SCGC-AAA385D11]